VVDLITAVQNLPAITTTFLLVVVQVATVVAMVVVVVEAVALAEPVAVQVTTMPMAVVLVVQAVVHRVASGQTVIAQVDPLQPITKHLQDRAELVQEPGVHRDKLF
jgi:hypothetical protein